MSGIREFDLGESIKLAVDIIDKDTRQGIPNLTNVRIVILRRVDKSVATPAPDDDLFAQVSASVLPGRYEIEIDPLTLINGGGTAGIYDYRAIANDSQAMEVLPESFEILPAAAVTPSPAAPSYEAGSLEDLQARRASLIAKREALVTKVAAGDKSVDYDLGQIGPALAEINRQIALLEGTTRANQIRIYTDKGL